MGLFNFKNNKPIEKNAEKLYASSRSFQSVGTKCEDGRYISSEELYDYIADYFSEPLVKYGFKYLKSKKNFKRTTQDGCDEIGISFIDHVHYHLSFIFYKRIDSLQKIITSIEYEIGLNTIKNYKEHHTVWTTYSDMFGQRDIEIVSYSVLEKELPKVLTLIESEIIPYFDRLNDVNFVNQTINYPEKDTKNPFSHFAKDVYGNSGFISTGLIIAKTLKDPNYNNLLNSYMTKFPQNKVLKEELIKLDEYFKQKEIEK